MKRKSFLLSLPLIGMAVKALAKPKETVFYDKFGRAPHGGRFLTLQGGDVPDWKILEKMHNDESFTLWDNEKQTGVTGKFVWDNPQRTEATFIPDKDVRL